MKNKTNVFITGVAGMIGSHLLDELLDSGRYAVVGLDDLSFGRIENIAHRLGHPDFRFQTGDVRDRDTVRDLAREAAIIVHLAAVKKIAEADSSLPTLTVNARGVENVFAAAAISRCKVVLASTSDVYGMSLDLPHREDGDLLLGPSMIKRWSYAVSKLYGEQYAFAHHQDFGIPVVILRYFGGFSPRSSFRWSGGHIPIFVDAVLGDREVAIHGDGSQTRSMAYVSDLVRGTVRAMEEEKAVGEIINLGNDEEMSVLEAARLIHRLAATGKELRIKFVPLDEIFGRYKDVLRRRPDLSQARRLLGYAPRVGMEEAIRLMLDARRGTASG